MSDITELERRITAAMDRIAQGIDAVGQGAAADDLAKTRQALEDERLVTAQLQERIKALHQKQDEKTAALDAELDSARKALTRLDHELQRMRKVTAQMEDSVTKLREANAAGVGEPHLINKAMLAELEALRAARAVDVAEAEAIVSLLAPLLAAPNETTEKEPQDA